MDLKLDLKIDFKIVCSSHGQRGRIFVVPALGTLLASNMAPKA